MAGVSVSDEAPSERPVKTCRECGWTSAHVIRCGCCGEPIK